MKKLVSSFLFLCVAVVCYGGQNLLENPAFRFLNEKGVPRGWFVHGNTTVSVKDGAVTVDVPADGAQPFGAMMQHLAGRLAAGKSYVLTLEASAPVETTGMLYLEGHYVIGGRRQGWLTKDNYFKVDASGTTRRIAFTIPAPMERLYVSLRTTKKGCPITFRNLKLEEEGASAAPTGARWENRSDASPDGGLLLAPGTSAILRDVAIVPGRTYHLSFEVVGSGATGFAGYDFYDYRLSCRPVFAGGLSFQQATASKSHRNLVITIPEGTSRRTIDITFSSQSFGTLVFTGIRFQEGKRPVDEEWAFFFTEPCYRDTIHQKTDTGFLAGEVLAGPPAVAAEVAIGDRAPIRVALQDGKGRFRVPAGELAPGAYAVQCRVFDARGSVLKSFQRTLRKVVPAAHEVLVDERQTLLVDGKPFVPIIEYRTRTGFLPGGFYHLARHGINTIMLVNLPADEKNTLSILDRLQAVGMKGIIELWSASACTPESQQRFQKRYEALMTPAVRQHPAFLAYFTNDEPFACSRNPAPIIWTHHFLQEHDPYHPVWVGQSPRDVAVVNLRPYADGSDITGIDIYPIPVPHIHCDLPDKSLNCVGAYTRRIREVVYGRKPVWMTIQAFHWDDHNFPKSTTRRTYPTEDETRFMAFDALFNDARAIVLYGTPTIKSMLYRRLIYSLTEELQALSGLIAGGTALPDLPHGTPLARVARRTCGGQVYYGLFNQEPKEKTLVFAMERPLVIYREGRRLVPQDGKISVKLRAHEVIVCGEAPLPAPVNSRPACEPRLEDQPDPAFGLILNLNGQGEDIFASQHYRGKANWIWNREQVKSAGSACVLTKRFTLAAPPREARLLFCADDEADAYLNGHPVGNGDGHGRLHEYDVRGLLRQGENVLLIHARDGGGLPCAMLAELQVDGKPILVTDESWRGRAARAGEDFTATEERHPTTPAAIVAPAGGGVWRYPLLPLGN